MLCLTDAKAGRPVWIDPDDIFEVTIHNKGTKITTPEYWTIIVTQPVKEVLHMIYSKAKVE